MTKYFYNTETGQADGTAVSTALLPANGVTPTLTVSGTPTVQFKTSAAAEGSLGIRIATTAASQIVQIRFPGLNATDVMWDGAIDCNGSYPSSGCRFITFHNNSFATLVGGLSLSATGIVSILNSAGTGTAVNTTPMPITGKWRYAIRLTQGTTTSNGIVSVWLYRNYADLVGSVAAADMATLTNVNLLTTATPMTGVIKGKITTAPTWTALDLDADQITDNPSVDGLFTGPNGGTTPVVKTVATTWKVRAGVVRTAAASWNVRAAVAATRAASWKVRQAVLDSVASSWRVRQALTRTIPASWKVRTAVVDTIATAWKVRQAITASRASSWRVRALVAKTIAASWNVRRPITTTAVAAWAVLASTVKTVASSWRVRTAVERELESNWHTQSDRVLRDIALTAEPLADRWSAVELEDRYTTKPLGSRWTTDPASDRFTTTALLERWTTTPEDS